MPLTQTGLVRAENQRQVDKNRNRLAQRAVEKDLFWRIRNMVCATHNVSDPHVGVIDNDPHVVSRIAIGSDQNEVLDGVAADRYFTEDFILENNRPIGNLEANGPAFR